MESFADIMKTVGGYWGAKAVMVGVRLDIFTVLARCGELSVPELASQLGCQADGLRRLLQALAAMGLLESGTQGYRASALAAQYLNRDSESYQGAIIEHHNDLWRSWSDLELHVRGDVKADFLQQIERKPAEIRHFIWGMHHAGLETAAQLAAHFADQHFTRMLDIGGGPGTFAMAMAREQPELKGDIYDLEQILSHTRGILAQHGFADRIGTVCGDFNSEQLPSDYDFVLLSRVTHIESVANNQLLLDKVFTALRPGGVVCIHDFLISPAGDGPLFSALFSLNMLVRTPRGDVFTAEQYSSWLQNSGFAEISVLELEGTSDCVVARKPA